MGRGAPEDGAAAAEYCGVKWPWGGPYHGGGVTGLAGRGWGGRAAPWGWEEVGGREGRCGGRDRTVSGRFAAAFQKKPGTDVCKKNVTPNLDLLVRFAEETGCKSRSHV